MRDASTTSPLASASGPRSAVGAPPPAGTNSIFTVVSAAMVADFSEPKKSSPVMCTTLVLESLGHARSLCGFFCAKAFTGAATRRSELPSRSTGFTALPSTLE